MFIHVLVVGTFNKEIIIIDTNDTSLKGHMKVQGGQDMKVHYEDKSSLQMVFIRRFILMNRFGSSSNVTEDLNAYNGVQLHAFDFVEIVWAGHFSVPLR